MARTPNEDNLPEVDTAPVAAGGAYGSTEEEGVSSHETRSSRHGQSRGLGAAELCARWLENDGGTPRPESTQRAYRRALRLWLAFLGQRVQKPDLSAETLLWEANPSLVREWQAELRQSGRSVATINQMLSAVSSFYGYVLHWKLAPTRFRANPLQRQVRRGAIDAYAKARVLSLAEYRQLIDWLEMYSGSLASLRTHALIRILLHTGWRAGELLAMRAGDLKVSRVTAGALRYRCVMANGREFVDILPPDCVAVLHAYLDRAGRPLESLPEDASIWTSVRAVNLSGFGAVQDREERICVRSALRAVRTYLRSAGIENADSIRLHDLRHTHAFLLHEGGASTEVISKRMRYTATQSTERLIRGVLSPGEVDTHSALFAALRKRLSTGK